MIQQGHKYSFMGAEVIAIEQTGQVWRVRPVSVPWLGDSRYAKPDQLIPLPMKYFHNQLPQGDSQMQLDVQGTKPA